MRWIGVLVIVTAALFITVNSYAGDKEKKSKHWERARGYLNEAKYNEAVIELRNVIQLDPKDDRALYELGETYMKLKKPKEAFQSYSRAVAANPDHYKAQLKIGTMLLLARQTKKAKEP